MLNNIFILFQIKCLISIGITKLLYHSLFLNLLFKVWQAKDDDNQSIKFSYTGLPGYL